MERKTKEKIAIGVALTLLAMVNGAAGARVLHSLLRDWYKKRDAENKMRMMSERSFRTALCRLKKQGIVESGGYGLWHLTTKGRALAQNYKSRQKDYERTRELSRARKDTVVIFDVPENRRTVRDYLRIELVSLGYEQLQKSVWIGGGPLPEAFMEFVLDKKLVDFMHIFTIVKKGTIAV